MFFGQGQLKTAGRRDADHGIKSPPVSSKIDDNDIHDDISEAPNV